MDIGSLFKKEKMLLVVAIAFLGTLIAQSSLVVLSILSITRDINVPLLLEKISSDGATTFKATPLLIFLSYAITAILLWYSKPTPQGSRQLRIVQVIVVVLAISIIVLIFGSIVACGVVCPRLACHGAMDSCTWHTGLFYVKYVCNCIVS
ncbi:MAG: hypothetical protein XD43_1392 [Thermococcales archaeon 44_46]|uniref:hypothetical protein n=1 Tax=Thermococcus sp. PK TaxID=913025 RepID=UPI0005B2A109|nr:hypothetical protein [Thermococcus sp. PK]KUJ98937.1 MAG: hypothetical protein XD43_1392 [Thermococcales archaeon 44_46]MDK2854370.1 hypothetical protein [Thermococcaceae archaeon]HIH71892.1 hypothetical protein [Thermococcaceae archaeon]